MFFQKNAILIAPNFVSYCGVRRSSAGAAFLRSAARAWLS